MLTRRLAVFGLVWAVLGGTAALSSAAAAPLPFNPIAQAEQPDTGSVPSPSDSDDEIQLVMALLIAVAVIALLGTFVYWVRTGDSSRRGDEEPPSGADPQDTLG